MRGRLAGKNRSVSQADHQSKPYSVGARATGRLPGAPASPGAFNVSLHHQSQTTFEHMVIDTNYTKYVHRETLKLRERTAVEGLVSERMSH